MNKHSKCHQRNDREKLKSHVRLISPLRLQLIEPFLSSPLRLLCLLLCTNYARVTHEGKKSILNATQKRSIVLIWKSPPQKLEIGDFFASTLNTHRECSEPVISFPICPTRRLTVFVSPGSRLRPWIVIRAKTKETTTKKISRAAHNTIDGYCAGVAFTFSFGAFHWMIVCVLGWGQKWPDCCAFAQYKLQALSNTHSHSSSSQHRSLFGRKSFRRRRRDKREIQS